MKEIKFREWDGEDMTYRPSIVDEPGEEFQGLNDFFEYLKNDGSTFMQYTGLKDKNGKEIYEGDIIKYISWDGKQYQETCPALTSFHWWQETADNDSVEIIGNKFENPIVTFDLSDLKEENKNE